MTRRAAHRSGSPASSLLLPLAAVLLALAARTAFAASKPDAKIDVLAGIELTRGSDDTTVKGGSLSADARRGPSPSHVFGVDRPNKKPDNAEDNTDDDDLWTAGKQKEDADELGAQLVRAQNSLADPNNHNERPLTRQWEDVLARNPEAEKQYRDAFEELDRDSNKKLNDYEINAAVNDGTLSPIGARTLKTWDVNYDRKVSWQEFRMGPLFLIVLENNQTLFNDFRTNAHGSSSAVTQFLRKRVLSAYQVNQPASMTFLQTDERVDRSTTSLDEATMRELGLDHVMENARAQQQGGVYPQASDEQHPELYEDPAEARFAESHRRFIGKFLKKAGDVVKKVVGGAGSIAGKVSSTLGLSSADAKTKDKRVLDAQKTRYQSKFGVPKYEDERCVLCQFVMQQIEAELKTKVVDDATAFSDWPQPATEQTGGMNSLDGAVGRDPNTRPSRRLHDSRGERSPTRVVTEVGERVMRDVCGDTAPYLYREPCLQIWRLRRDLAHGVVRKLPAGANCQKVRFCATGTYFYNGFAVHYPEMSNKFNGGRGLCGMIGGPNARKIPGLSEGTCFLKTLGKHAGLSMFRFQRGQVRAPAGVAGFANDDSAQEDPTDPTPTTSISLDQQEAQIEAASAMLQQQQDAQQEGEFERETPAQQQDDASLYSSQPTPVPPQ